MSTVSYQERHIGPDQTETSAMLKAIGVSSMDELIQRTVPKGIRSKGAMGIGEALTERDHLEAMRVLGAKNKVFRSYIGMCFSNTVLPAPIQRNVYE
ncbi:MAG: glycine dehydrogenase (aminomethyl-transferring), partial [Flavobacteriales bacterium]|nr:glycine dehydrogenase (aminomethyl-transferring) [Flavobacteriales bacterium]